MKLTLFDLSYSQEVVSLFTRVFSASEGEDEGNNIGSLVSNLIEKTDPSELIGCLAIEEGSVVGAIFFSRFFVSNGELAFILSPVAIETSMQGSGVGQRLIHYGLDHLRSKDVSLVLTYGDPAFYSKTGFEQISENTISAPFPLSQPIGWLAQSLEGKTLPTMSGPSRCVDAFNDPSYW